MPGGGFLTIEVATAEPEPGDGGAAPAPGARASETTIVEIRSSHVSIVFHPARWSA